MDLPFTTEQFLGVFRDYNRAIWPIQIAAVLLGLGAIGLTFRRPSWSRTIGGVLAAFWGWMGAVYHLMFFREINSAAVLFGVLFLVQGLLFAYVGSVRNDLTFRARADLYGWVGGLFMAYALVIYPVIGAHLGHGYPQAPMFGVAPCPTTIFTFGLLLWTTGRVPGWLLVIPTLWALIGFNAALTLGIFEDIGLLVAGLLGAGLLLYDNHSDHGTRKSKASTGATA
ncbi:hypothetical protein GGQ07_000023 [Salinibacter ruber]|uniref:DUF6064 family protein n=1 Tax=Salinibacter ruber TaxID=146919 RepID=UPI0021693248|nr:DUF6064 family protein [Salinibacter ruber]MCS4178611.1 hypothetical protein [Salinibacter ruber]